MSFEDKLKEIGIKISEVSKPAAEYIPAKKVDNLVYCSGQGPLKDGKFIYIGRVGDEVSLDDGYEAAKICAINCLAAIKSVIGSLDEIEEIISLRGFVNSNLDFYRQPEVINDASELMV